MRNGAAELEIHANIGLIRKRKYDEVQAELSAIRRACGQRVIKLVLDTETLFADEQIAVCTIASSAKINYIAIASSATDFPSLLSDVCRIKNSLGDRARIKVSLGADVLCDARELHALGVSRIGESDIFAGLVSFDFRERVTGREPEIIDIECSLNANDAQITELFVGQIDESEAAQNEIVGDAAKEELPAESDMIEYAHCLAPLNDCENACIEAGEECAPEAVADESEVA